MSLEHLSSKDLCKALAAFVFPDGLDSIFSNIDKKSLSLKELFWNMTATLQKVDVADLLKLEDDAVQKKVVHRAKMLVYSQWLEKEYTNYLKQGIDHDPDSITTASSTVCNS